MGGFPKHLEGAFVIPEGVAIEGMPETDVSSLGHVPRGDRWVFDETVAACFGDMLRRSIPGYLVMRDLVTRLATKSIVEFPGATVIDLGASIGDGIANLSETFPATRFWAVECAPAMRSVLNARFGSSPNVRVYGHDLRNPARVQPGIASVVLSVLTLQFLPPRDRLRVLREAHEALFPGGRLILVEKVIGSTVGFDDDFVCAHHQMKVANGYALEEVERKRLALEGVLVPFTASKNEELLREAGFGEVECFWRALNFAGWLAVKDPENGYTGAW